MSKVENETKRPTRCVSSEFWYSGFGFVSDFDIRIWDFFCLARLPTPGEILHARAFARLPEKSPRNPQPLRLRTPHPGRGPRLGRRLRRRGPHRPPRQRHRRPPSRPRPAVRVRRTPRVMLAGHCDQIGLMVQHIDDNGFLYVQPIGGWDMQILLGQHLTVWTERRPRGRRHRPAGDAPADQRGTQQGAAVHRRLGGHRRQGPQGRRGTGVGRRSRSRSSWAIGRCATAWRRRRPWTTKWVSGRSWKRCGCCSDRPLQCSRLLRLHGAGGDRPARGHDQRLRHPPDGRHRRGRLPRHGHARQRQEAAGRHAARRRPGAVPRPEHQPARAGAPAGTPRRRPRSPCRCAARRGRPAPTPTPCS